jgi:hypothetical protein
MERENPSASKLQSDILEPPQSPGSDHTLQFESKGSIQSSVDRVISETERERNFYRAKCRRLACEREKLMSMNGMNC